MSRFFLYLVTAYLTMNGWVLLWFWGALKGAGKSRWVVCLALLLLMSFFPLLYRNGDLSGSLLGIVALRAGCVWIGSFFYVFLMTAAASIANLFLKHFQWQYRANKPRQALLILGLAIFIALGGAVNASFPALREIRLEASYPAPLPEGIPREITLVAIADVHLGRVSGVGVLSRAIDLILPHEPDAVLFLGDMLDDHIAVDEAGLKRELGRIKPRYGHLGILGNHEYISGPIGTSIEILERNGIKVLRDEYAVLGSEIVLVGRDDRSKTRRESIPRKSIEGILEGLDETVRQLPVVVLDHQPYNLEEAERAGALLQLSGHTHNGQLWPYNLVVKRIYENARGHYVRGNTNYIVSIGTGTWGPPLRNNARPEVWLIRLVFREAEGEEDV